MLVNLEDGLVKRDVGLFMMRKAVPRKHIIKAFHVSNCPKCGEPTGYDVDEGMAYCTNQWCKAFNRYIDS